jgi:hypothetical protein
MDLPEELARFVPHWETLFLNLHRTPAEMLTRFSTAVGYALKVMQAECAPLEELERVLEEALAGLEGLSEDQAGQWLRMAWFILLLAYHRRERGEYDRLQVQIMERTRASKFGVQREVGEMVQSMAQYVEARGIEIGEARGEARGRETALRGALVTVLTARFGEVAPEVVAALDAADVDQLNRWLPLAATAESLSAVGIVSTN